MRTLLILLALFAGSSTSSAEPLPGLETVVGEMRLKTTVQGEPLPAADAKYVVVCFLGVECPVSRYYSTRLNSLAEQYGSQQIQFIGVFSNLQDSTEDVQQFSEQLQLSFPVLLDTGQTYAKRLGATRVPEVFVLDPIDQIHYRGRIDDQYAPGVKRAAANQHDLKLALDKLLSQQEPSPARTDAVGCLITFAKETDPRADVTYCNQIARLLYGHCLECHRQGEIGPFDVSDYDEVRGWANMMLEVVQNRRMPPWHADPHVGSFQNVREMPEQAAALLQAWIDAGTPYGDAHNLPAQPQFVDGWRLPHSPDSVVAMRETAYRIPAAGTVDYQYFVVDPQFTEDRWVSAAQVIPGNPAVVHHAIVFVRPPDGTRFEGIGWLTAYVPGQRATTFPPGYARKIPAGSKLVFQMHYTPNGTEQSDRTQVGMTFTSADAITHEVTTIVGINQDFEIPPSAANHLVSGKVSNLPQSGELLAIMPHMHLRGKSFELSGIRSATNDSPQVPEPLLRVPQYDFNWQHTYELSQPLPLDSFQSLQFTASFDNSPSNPFNPAPQEYVTWGDQTWEEMAVVFLEVARPRTPSDAPDRPAALEAPKRATSVQSNIQPVPQAVAFANQFLSKFDRNGDGKVVRAELPRIVRDYSFHIIDADGNQEVTKEELIESAGNPRGRK